MTPNQLPASAFTRATPDQRTVITRMDAGLDILGQVLRTQAKAEPGSEAFKALENQVYEILYYIACEGSRIGFGYQEIRDMGLARGRKQ